MKCKGCNKDKKLVKSHIIPESFYRGLRESDEPIRMYSTTKGEFPKKAPIGVYDKTILCNECEDRFDSIDSYGHEVLLNREESHKTIENAGKLYGYEVNDIDTGRLKLFFMSILWRASISSQSFFERVKLGPFENRLKDHIWSEDPGGDHDFSYVISKFNTNSAGRTILSPHSERFFDVKYYRFYLYGFTLYIKVDSRATPTEWNKFIPRNGSQLIVYRGNIEEKKEFPVMLSAYNKNRT